MGEVPLYALSTGALSPAGGALAVCAHLAARPQIGRVIMVSLSFCSGLGAWGAGGTGWSFRGTRSKYRSIRCLHTEQFLTSTTKINGPICKAHYGEELGAWGVLNGVRVLGRGVCEA